MNEKEKLDWLDQAAGETPRELTPEQCASLIWNCGEESSTALAGMMGTTAAAAAYWQRSLRCALQHRDGSAAG